MESRLAKTCVTAYLNLWTESQKYVKLCDFCEKIFMDLYIDMIL